MAMRAVARRLSARHDPFPRILGCRAFGEDKGRILSEEERAAENLYIKKMEKERLEKLARKGLKPEQQATTDSSSGSGTDSAPTAKTITDNNRNIALLAGVVAVVAAGWWYFGSQPKAKEEEKY